MIAVSRETPSSTLLYGATQRDLLVMKRPPKHLKTFAIQAKTPRSGFFRGRVNGDPSMRGRTVAFLGAYTSL